MGTSQAEKGMVPRLRSMGRTPLLFLLIMTLGYTVFAADRTVLSATLKALSSGLGLSNSEKGLLSAAQYAGVLSFVFISGHLSDRYGTRKILIVGVSVFTASTWLIGLSSDFLQAFAFRLVSGFGEGIFWPVAMAAVANYFGYRKGLALGIFYVGFDVGGATGNFVGGVAWAGGWREAFFVAPLLGIGVVAGIFIARGTFAAANSSIGRVSLGRDALAMLKRKQVVLVMAFAFLATWASVWQVVYLPYYYSTVLGLSDQAAAALAAGVLLSGGLGKVVLGGASDRFRRDRLLAVLSLGVAAVYAVFFSITNLYLSAITALAAGFVSSAIFPVMQSLMADSCDGKTGTALGLSTTAQSVAAVLSTTVAASLFSKGVGSALGTDAMAAALLMLVVVLFLRDGARGGKRPW